MKRFKNILCVSGETPDQGAAVARAASLAKNHRATLTVIGVIPSGTSDLQETTSARHMQVLESLVKPYRRRLKIQLDLLRGPVFSEVIRAVLRNAHDLVIKAAESPDLLKRLFGSDDMHLLRKCPCPVWLLNAPGKSNCDRIMAAVGFDPLASSAVEEALNLEILEQAASLALSEAASLHVVHAWEAFAERTMLLRGDIPKERIAAHVEKQHLLNQNRLYALGRALRDRIGSDAYDRLSPRFLLPKGPAKKMIAALAAELRADLVVMGTVARTGISGLIMGNTAEAILDQLTCSVLAIKPPGFKTPVDLPGNQVQDHPSARS